MMAVLEQIVTAAAEATGAAAGWISRLVGDDLVVEAAVGTATDLTGQIFAAGEGPSGLAVASGQPVARRGLGVDELGVAGALDPRPLNVLSVPCSTAGGPVGVLEVADKAGAAMFSIDDIELVTTLASVAGAALGELPPSASASTGSASGAGASLARLARRDPIVHDAVLVVVRALAEQ